MLPKNRRVSRDRDWQKIHHFGRSVFTAELVLKYLKNSYPQTRFGFITGKKISNKSTRRNLIKRRLRAIIQKNLPIIKNGYDIILIARPPIAKGTYQSLSESVLALLKRSHLLNQ